MEEKTNFLSYHLDAHACLLFYRLESLTSPDSILGTYSLVYFQGVEGVGPRGVVEDLNADYGIRSLKHIVWFATTNCL